MGHHRWLQNQFPPFFSVLHCPLGLGKLRACLFPDVVFQPLLLSALSSSPFHCALQDGFGQNWWTEDMSIPLQFVSLYGGQEVFVWSNCLLGVGTDFLIGNMVFVWDAQKPTTMVTKYTYEHHYHSQYALALPTKDNEHAMSVCEHCYVNILTTSFLTPFVMSPWTLLTIHCISPTVDWPTKPAGQTIGNIWVPKHYIFFINNLSHRPHINHWWTNLKAADILVPINHWWTNLEAADILVPINHWWTNLNAADILVPVNHWWTNLKAADILVPKEIYSDSSLLTDIFFSHIYHWPERWVQSLPQHHHHTPVGLAVPVPNPATTVKHIMLTFPSISVWVPSHK